MHEKNVVVVVGRCLDAELKKQRNIFGYRSTTILHNNRYIIIGEW